jgi:hypothetical protein
MENNVSENDLIINLVKLGKENHLKEIQNGKIRFTRLENYKNIENKNIGDINEGLESIIHTNNDTELFYSHQSIENGALINISKSIKSIANFPNNNYYVFCMAYFSINDIINKTVFDEKIYQEEKWTDVLFFINPKEFLQKVHEKIKNNSPVIGPVKYSNYNETQYNLDVLSKSNDYMYQKEYRIALNLKYENKTDIFEYDAKNDIVIVDIGSIKSESIIVTKKDFCNGFIIKDN